MKAAAKGNVDYTLTARTALKWLNDSESEYEAAYAAYVKREVTSREKWIQYGHGLLAGKAQHPSTKAFGAWVRDNGLDVGVAEHANVRSCAMWCAEHEADLKAHELKGFQFSGNHPVELRRQARARNLPWAAKPKSKAKPDPDEQDDAEAEDPVTTPEEWWQRTAAWQLGDLLALSAIWTKDYPGWEKYVVPSTLATLARQVAEALPPLLNNLIDREETR